MKRIAAGLYGFLAYLAFLLPIGYLVGFLADAGVPKTVDRGAGPPGPAVLVDLALVLAFGLQHSIMARPAFKRWLQRRVPEAMERSTYVLASGVTLALVFWLWRPIPALLWDVSGTPLEAAAWAGYAAGWGLAVWATFALSHLHLFGVAQVAAYVRGRRHPRMALRETPLYRIVRHPMTAGLLLAFWSTPRMTLGHLVFAAGMTAYSLWATVLEERDLLRSFPESYRTYRARVPALVPVLRPGWLLPARGGLGPELAVVGAGLALFAALPLYGARSAVAAEEPPPDLERYALEAEGGRRSYALFDPAPGAAGSRPLVLALHGTGGDAARLHGFLGGELERVARSRGWLVAYPEAYERAWNDCRRSNRSPARRSGIDDVAFLRSLVARLARERGADPERVFLLGYSGGGHLAFRVGLEAPALARGIAVFGASLPAEGELLCRPAPGTVPLLMVNGDRDLVNPYDGGEVVAPLGQALGTVRSSAESLRFFAERASRGTEARLVTLPGGGHAVPGPASRFPRAVGRTLRSYAGVEEAAAFFARQLSLSREDGG